MTDDRELSDFPARFENWNRVSNGAFGNPPRYGDWSQRQAVVWGVTCTLNTSTFIPIQDLVADYTVVGGDFGLYDCSGRCY